jgi:PAS domain S-box-containing protein
MSRSNEPSPVNAGAIDLQGNPGQAGRGPAPSGDDEHISMLLVDDEPRNLTVLETVLADPSYRLVRAESAEQALLALVSEEFALLILDIHMPGMSGFELAQLIKQRKKTAGVPIIFLTAYYSEDQHVLEGYGTGAVDYLHKPINPTILRSKVAVFAELHRKSRESERANRTLQNEVTARRRADEQLRQLNDELERRVAERTATLQQREREMRSLADNTPDILTRFDQELRYVFVNSAIEKATGQPPNSFLGQAIRDVGMPDDVCDLWEQALRFVFETKKHRSIEFGYVGSGGMRRYATRMVPEFGPSGETEFVLGVTQDITDRKRAEEALKHADRRKDEFLATLAHELRNPLAPLRTGLHVLNMSRDAAVAVDTQKMMDRQLSHMVRLIDDLLDVSRITSDKLTLRKERVSLRALVETAVEASRPVVEAAGHAMTVSLPEEPIWLDADPTRLAQVVSNLLTNAAKYTPERGCIQLVARREGAEVAVRVTDTGLGIPPGMLGAVFEMFAQVNRTLDRAQGGLGIGLALVKRLVELHCGTITAESPGLGQGSSFTVRLPLVEPHAGDTEPETTPPVTSAQPLRSGRRVLVVDDNVDGAESLARVLQFGGHDTRTAHSGPEALDAARPFKPEVVFLDIGLPGMNGYEVARRLRGEPSLRGAVLVALTGWGTEDDKRQSREAGFDFHLTKPAEVTAIESILARVARGAGQRNSSEAL